MKKGHMKKLFLGLSLIALLAGCASHENENGTGGTSDQYNQSQSTGQSSNNTNPTQGTGASSMTSSNNASGEGTQQ